MKKCEDNITKSYTFRFYALYKPITISFCPQFADSPYAQGRLFPLAFRDKERCRPHLPFLRTKEKQRNPPPAIPQSAIRLTASFAQRSHVWGAA